MSSDEPMGKCGKRVLRSLWVAELILLRLELPGEEFRVSSPSHREMSESVLVIGSTGTQGGAVVNHLLEDQVTVYGLTRDSDRDKARALKESGANVVEGDLDDRDSLEAAMEGVEGVWCVTNFWEHGYETEVQHGKERHRCRCRDRG